MLINDSSHFIRGSSDSRSEADLPSLIHMPSTGSQRVLPKPHTSFNWLALAGSAPERECPPLPTGRGQVARPAAASSARISPLMDAVFGAASNCHVQLAPPASEVASDIDALLEGFSLQRIRRFHNQRHWRGETEEADFADRVEPGLKLENVAAHSWHVADAAYLLVGHFPDLDAGRVVLLALLHDKLEIYTGDYDPVGPDGNGRGTHAFDEKARRGKEAQERYAAERYLAKLRPEARERQRGLLSEVIEGTSPEAKFVKAIDKLQALAFVMEKKEGRVSDDHLLFTLIYSRKALTEFPRIRFHYAELLNRFLDSVAAGRGTSRSELDKRVFGQLELPL